MDNRVRQWYLVQCKNYNVKPTVQGLKEYWLRYKLLLDSKLCDRLTYIYKQIDIKCFADFNKYTIHEPY